jgi:hypothetical protein
MAFDRAETEVSAVALELDLAIDDVSWIDMAVTAAIDLGRDAAGGALVSVELDLDTDWPGWIDLGAEADERTVAAEFERETEGGRGGSWLLEMEGTLDNDDGNWWSDEIEPFLDTGACALRIVAEELERDTEMGASRTVAVELERDTEVGAPRAVAVELERDIEVGSPRAVAEELARDTVPCGCRALAEEFALETGDAMPLALSEGKIVVAPATDWGIVTTVLALDKAFAGGAFTEGAFAEGVVVWALVMELVRDRVTKEEESLYFEDLVDAERTVETESDLDIETVDDLGLEADLMLGSGSSR